MKRTLGMLAAISLSLGTAQAAKITVWTSYESAGAMNWLKDAAKAYSKSSGNDVNIVSVPFGDLKQKTILGAPKGEGPDLVISVPHDWVGEMAAAGVLEPMDNYMSEANKSAVSKTALTAFTYKGKLFGVPMFAEAVSIVYNKKHVPTAPKTWNEFLTVAKKLTDPGKGTFGFLADIGNSYFDYGFFSAYGAYVFKNNGGTLDPKDVGLSNAGAQKALSFINDLRFKYDLVKEGVDYNVAKGAFLDGSVGMFLTGPWDMGDIKKAKIDFGIAPMPKPPGASNDWSPFIGVQGVLMNSYSKSKAESAAFVASLLTTKNLVAFNKADGRIPVNRSAVASLASDPVVKGFSVAISRGVPMPNIPEMGAVWGPWSNAVNLGTQKANANYASILDAAVKEIKSNIK